jgi:hypothetical protein
MPGIKKCLYASFALAAIFLPFLASCKGAPISSGSTDASDLKLSFQLLGASAPAGAPTSISPLILPTATTLTVSLTPQGGGSSPAPEKVTIVDSEAVTVSFMNVEYGSYQISAVAADAGGNAQFRASSTVTVSETTSAQSLVLLPTGSNLDTTAITNSYPATYIGGGTLAANSTIAYLIPADAWNASYDYYYLDINIGAGATDGMRFYVQDADGRILSEGEVDSIGDVSATTLVRSNTGAEVRPSSRTSPTYVTFYNYSSTDTTNVMASIYTLTNYM